MPSQTGRQLAAPGDKGSKTPVGRRPVGTLSWQGGYRAWPDAYAFVAGEVLLDLSFPAAAARLATLARGSLTARRRKPTMMA